MIQKEKKHNKFKIAIGSGTAKEKKHEINLYWNKQIDDYSNDQNCIYLDSIDGMLVNNTIGFHRWDAIGFKDDDDAAAK